MRDLLGGVHDSLNDVTVSGLNGLDSCGRGNEQSKLARKGVGR